MKSEDQKWGSRRGEQRELRSRRGSVLGRRERRD